MNNQTHKYFTKFGISVLLILFIAGCGGAALQVANGIGGTGVTMGRITAFGSIYVNGVEYNTDNASFTRNGISSKQQSDFNTGEIVRVVGNIHADKITGTATEVIFSNVLTGPVNKLLDKKTIEVLGQTITTNALTVFHGINKLSELELGNMLEISGFIAKNGGITASSIRLIETQFVEGSILDIEGTISQLDTDAKTFVLNGNLTVDYSVAQFTNIKEESLANNLYLYIFAEQNISNDRLLASNIEAIDDNFNAPDIEYELEGYITRYVSPTDFDVDGLRITTNSQTLYKIGTAEDLTLDMRVIVKGVTNKEGAILLDEISIYDDLSDIFVEAKIEAIDYNEKTLSLQGKTIHINSFTLLSDETTENVQTLLLTQFNIGDAIFINFYINDKGKNIATRLSKIDPLDLLIEDDDEGL